MLSERSLRSRRYKNSVESERTILGAAVELFRENGFESTTMRAIAQRAGVSLGNAYYYFPAKEFLIISLYKQINDEQLKASRFATEGKTNLADALERSLKSQLKASLSYRQVLQDIFRQAADFRSPLNPFSADTKQIRSASLSFFTELVFANL